MGAGAPRPHEALTDRGPVYHAWTSEHAGHLMGNHYAQNVSELTCAVCAK